MPYTRPSPLAALAFAVLAGGCSGGSAGGGSPGTCDLGGAVPATATVYTTYVQGACSFPSVGTLYTAVGPGLYAGAAGCGTCLEVTGPKGTVMVPVVDLCPDCGANDVDLSPDAFAVIAEPAMGPVAVSWKKVPCPEAGPVRFHVFDGANAWYVPVVVLDHRWPIDRVELRPTGASAWLPTQRQSDNVFVRDGDGPYPTPVDVRTTDVFGHAVTGTIPDLAPGIEAEAGGQLAATCP
jgi:expansin (peptidoglycan-binding protein)